MPQAQIKQSYMDSQFNTSWFHVVTMKNESPRDLNALSATNKIPLRK